MSVSVYSHHMTNAPSVNGAIGGLIPLLDAVLVNGISMPSVSSITRSGNTATLVFSNNHGLKYSTRLTVSGCAETDYNGTFVVTVVDPTTVTYTVANTPATPATGTPSAIITSAGWSKPFSGTNLAAYRPASGTRHYLRVDDTTTTYAKLNGYEDMTAISSGTNLFPTAVQVSALYMFKSSTTDTTARPWLVIASDKWVYVWVGRALTVAGDYASSTTWNPVFFFGDYESLMLGDAFNSALIGSAASTTAGANLGSCSPSSTTANSAHYLSRSYTGAVGAVNFPKHSWTGSSSVGTMGADSSRAYPDPISGGICLAKVYVSESATPRGVMPALYNPSANLPGNPGDTFTGRGALTGKTFLLMDVGAGGTTRSRVAFDITPAV